jgi:hypothetical protein
VTRNEAPGGVTQRVKTQGSESGGVAGALEAATHGGWIQASPET